MRKALLLWLLMAATFVVAQGQSPAPPPNAPSTSSNPQGAQSADPLPAEQTEEEKARKKSLMQRIKDQMSDPWCVHVGTGPCREVGPKSKDEKSSDGKSTDTKSSGSDEEQSAPNDPRKPPMPGKNEPMPRSDSGSRSGEMSSSRDSIIDLSPPPGDARKHPESSTNPDDDVAEFHKWDPHKAAKDVEVGDFYFSRKNYAAALSRYQEALEFKPNDAIATFRMAEAEEKLKQVDEASQHYADYLRILPRGPLAEDAREALARLGAPVPPPAADSGPAAQNQAPSATAAPPRNNLKQHLKNQLTDFCVNSVTRNCPAKPPVLDQP